MRQLAMIYPTFTPASTSSVVSSAFDTSHAPELPTGQTACWRLIFTRLATYFTRLSTELFSLGSKLILTRLKTYFHSARHWLAQAYKNKVCPGPRHVGALLDFFWCKDKPLRLTTIWAPCTGGWDALNMVHDAGAGGLHWYSVDPFRFCTGLLNTAPQCSGLVQWPGALTKIHLVHRIGVFTSYLLWFSCAGAVQCCWCTRPLPTPAAPPWGETAPDSTNQWCSHNLKLVLPQYDALVHQTGASNGGTQIRN